MHPQNAVVTITFRRDRDGHEITFPWISGGILSVPMGHSLVSVDLFDHSHEMASETDWVQVDKTACRLCQEYRQNERPNKQTTLRQSARRSAQISAWNRPWDTLLADPPVGG